MFVLLGLGFAVAMVFGGYLLSGGKLDIILHTLPFEMMIIGGSGLGTFLMANDSSIVKQTVSDIVHCIKGSKWRKKDYEDVLCLLYELIKLARISQSELEKHIEDPTQSTIFTKYKKISSDKFTISFICDYFRMLFMNFDDPHQVDEVMEKHLEHSHEETLRVAQAIQTTADALPALGIVAAVLGVIKTMASIDQPPAVLGKMIGGALVGTFLGVFLAYCIASPLAARLNSIHSTDKRFYNLIRDVVTAYLQKHSPHICVEIGRKNIPTQFSPSFYDMEKSLAAIAKS